MCKGGDEAFLRHIDRRVGIADLSMDHPIDRLAVARHQRAVAFFPAGKRARGEFAVIDFDIAARHCRGLVSASTMARSKRRAWSARSTARMANRCWSVCFWSIPMA